MQREESIAMVHGVVPSWGVMLWDGPTITSRNNTLSQCIIKSMRDIKLEGAAAVISEGNNGTGEATAELMKLGRRCSSSENC